MKGDNEMTGTFVIALERGGGDAGDDTSTLYYVDGDETEAEKLVEAIDANEYGKVSYAGGYPGYAAIIGRGSAFEGAIPASVWWKDHAWQFDEDAA